MKKIGFGRRLIAMLLVLTLCVSMVPNLVSNKVLAADGDLTTGTTGLTGGVNAQDTISWPIKIYDYLQDGMLFDYSSASDFYGTDEANGFAYGGGANVPMILDDSIIGVDYTISTTYDSSKYGYAFNTWGNRDSFEHSVDGDGCREVTRAVVAAQDNVSPMYLHVDYTMADVSTRSYGWVANFARDDNTYYTGDDVQYMVIVYRTNAAYSTNTGGKGRTFYTYWAVSDGEYSDDLDHHTNVLSNSGIDISNLTDKFGWNNTGTLFSQLATLEPSTDTWAYQVIDMKSDRADNPAKYPGIAANWNATWQNANGTTGSIDLSKDERVAGVGISYPVGKKGEAMDISHIAFFSNPEEAARFGENALEFDNDPGEYIGRSVTMSQKQVTSGGSYTSTGTAPTMTNGWDFTVPSSTSINNGWKDTTFTAWKSSYGMTTNTGTGTGYSYVSVTETGDNLRDSAPVWISSGTPKTTLRYITVVYRLHGIDSTNAYLNFYINKPKVTGKGPASTYRTALSIASETQWSSATFDLDTIKQWDASDYDSVTNLTELFIEFPGFTAGTQIMDIAYIEYFSSSTGKTAAETWGTNAAAYLNGFKATSGIVSVETTTTFGDRKLGGWNMGSNQAFTMLYSSTGGGWFDDGVEFANDGYTAGDAGNNVQDNVVPGGNNIWTNGYYSYTIGDKFTYPTDKINSYRSSAASYGYTVSDSIFLLDMYPTNKTYYGPTANGLSNYGTLDSALASLKSTSASNLKGATYEIGYGRDADTETYVYAKNTKFDMSQLKLGYTLYNTLTDGVMTAGLLQSSQATVTGIDGKTYTIMQYKEDTVSYIAKLLELTLVIPEKDYWGYNYTFVKGTPNGEQYGYADKAKTQPYDLASALRARLGITFTAENLTADDKTDAQNQPGKAKLGSATDTASRLYDTNGKNKLIGPFLSCKDNITTFYDAAYYLLHNLFVDNSYNQVQDEYNYLILSKGTVALSGKEAYVFDGGFTTASDLSGTSGIVYDPFIVGEDGKTTGTGTIRLEAANGKDQVYYSGGHLTTRFPFLPVTHADGIYGEDMDRYFQEDGATNVTDYADTYSTRNYNYVMAANGEFVYNYEDGLFFDFEGDDDVYMFVNGELVLDIGAAHSITCVSMNMNDYVLQAQKVMSALAEYGYYAGMPQDEFETVLAKYLETNSTYTAAELRRWHKLNLVDGQSYDIDFYYMERHGWGANMRIATNIVMTDPSMVTDKTAYQNGAEIPYGGIVDEKSPVEYGFAMTNEGNSKLYNLTFKDANIGVTLDATQGLVLHGDATVVSFTTNAVQNVTISGLHGAANLDNGTARIAQDGSAITFTDVPAGEHELKLYQMNTYEDAKVTVKVGGTTLGTYKVAGCRAKDAMGQMLDPSDLVITIDGWYDEAMEKPYDTLKVTVANNDELKAFLKSLQTDDGTENEDTGADSLFSGNGLWRHSTVTIRGIYYTLTDAQIKDKKFVNTVYTSATPGLKVSKVIKGEDTHIVRLVEDAIHVYQWADHELYIDNEMIKSYLSDMIEDSGAKNDIKFVPSRMDKNPFTYANVTYDSSALTLKINYPEPGTNLIYLHISASDKDDKGNLLLDEVVPLIVYVTDMNEDTVVLDYGIKADLTASGGVTENDYIIMPGAASTYQIMGLTNTTPGYLTYSKAADRTNKDINRIDFTANDVNKKLAAADGDYSYDTVKINGEDTDRLYFTPTSFMDQESIVFVAVSVYETGIDPSEVGPANGSANGAYSIDVTKEVQMWQKITVLPATVVYYEDDFDALDYKTTRWGTDGDKTSATFVRHGTGSDTLTQGVKAETPYGQDLAYQTSANAQMSGNSMTTISVKKGDVVASFAFTGTGFEIISRTNDFDSGSFSVDVYKAKYEDSELVKVDTDNDGDVDDDDVVKRLPVITEFDNNITCTTHDDHTVSGYCKDCGLAVSHNYEDGKCTVCGKTQVEYKLFGNINGEDVTSSDLTFVDGKLTTQFDLDSYVFVKADDTSYMAKSYPGNTATGTVLYTGANEKLRVPAGVDVTFTLVENANGSLCLSYSTSADDEGTLRTVYFKNADNWAQPYIYYWSDANNSMTTWPGVAMTKVEGTEDVFSYIVPAEAEQVIFNNNSGAQTGDALIPGDNFMFTWGSSWSVYGSASDSSSTTERGNAIHQVPVIRCDLSDKNNGEADTYIVEISGVPSCKFPDGFNYAENWDYENGKLKDEVIAKYALETYLYIDGIRIYQPMGATNENYYKGENGATFTELRNMILDGKAAVAIYDNGTTVYSGNISWTENRNSGLYDYETGEEIEYVGSQVNSIDDYMIVGPNNEAYLNGNNSHQAVIFYITEDPNVTDRTLQIAARAIDDGLFINGASSGARATLYLGMKDGEGYVWDPIDVVKSGTEQYYTIDYSVCPYTEDDNGVKTYQIALHVGSGMVSFTNLKYHGFTIPESNISEPTTYTYVDGVLQVPETSIYYLVGNINGEDVAMDALTSLSQYKFVRGSLTVTFTKDSYVTLKSVLEKTTSFYKLSVAQAEDATSVELEKTEWTTSVDNADLFYIPAGSEATFTLTENGENVTLSYTVPECEHEWGDWQVTAASCTEDGEQTRTCTLCGVDQTEVLYAAGSHTYGDDDTCDECGHEYELAYYLIGYINGANYGCEEDYTNMGEYKFDDNNQLVTSFTSNSYVFIKTAENRNWYMTEGWQGEETRSVILYNTNSSISESNKLFVPGGVEVTFTLVYNSEDDTITLSYTTGDPVTVNEVTGGTETANGDVAMNFLAIGDQMSSTSYNDISEYDDDSIESDITEPEVDPVVTPTLQLAYPSLSLEGEVMYNIYYTASDLDDVVEMGLITFAEELTDGTIDDAVDTISGYVTDGTYHMVRTNGISARELGDTLYFKVYAKLSDGSYVYSKVAGYSAAAYAKSVLSSDAYTDDMKALMVAMMDYGAAAQMQFGYKTDALMNSFLTDEQKALVSAYDASMIDDLVEADSSKVGQFVYNSAGYSKRYPSLSLEGAFSINYYFTAALEMDSDMTLYYWDLDTYNAVDELTAENATGSMTMEATGDGNEFWGSVDDIAAKQVNETVFVAGVYTSGGVTYSTGVLSYSIGNYCQSNIKQDGSTIDALAQAIAVYGYYAEAHFANQ